MLCVMPGAAVSVSRSQRPHADAKLLSSTTSAALRSMPRRPTAGRSQITLSPRCAAIAFEDKAASGTAARSVSQLGLAEWTVPFLIPAVAALATTTYAGAFAAGADPWVRALIIGAGPLVLHGVVPLVDWVLGERPPQPLPASAKAPSPEDLLPRLVPALYVLAHLTACVYAYATVASVPLQPGLLVLLAVSHGASAVGSLAASHELGHSRNPLHVAVGVLSLVLHWWYPWQRAHRQHHQRVGTPEDYTNATKDVSLYQFFWKYVSGLYIETWQLGVAEAEKAGKSAFSIHNSSLVAYVAQAALTAGIYAAFGPAATALHVGACTEMLISITIFDFVLHYGLIRPVLPGPGRRYAPVTHYNAWSSLYPLENATFFNALYHADHHVVGSKSYGWLRPPASTPTFPAPTNILALATLVPPLWRAIMDHRVDEANQRNREYLGLTTTTTTAAAAAAAATAAGAP